MRALVEQPDAQRDAGQRVERRHRRHRGREHTRLERRLAETHARQADRRQRPQLPVQDDGPEPLVQPLDHHLDEGGREPEEHAARAAEQERAR